MGEGLTWKGLGVGLVESNAERELYERTKEATEEAQRQGAEQLKAAVKAAGAVKPICDSFNRWSLAFKDSRVEGAYRLKSISNSDKIDSFPVACELAACTLHLFRVLETSGLLLSTLEALSSSVAALLKPMFLKGFRRMASYIYVQDWGHRTAHHWLLNYTKKMIPDSSSFPVHFLGYICVAVCCITVLSTQLLFSKWYQGCRGVILQYLTFMLWIWEGIEIFLMVDTDWTYISYHALALSTCMSILYQVPFCVHLRSRIFGLACQAAAIMARGKQQDMFTLLFVITSSHLLGVLLAYILDRRARLCFLKSVPCWLLDDITRAPLQMQFSEPHRESVFRQFWNMFYPNFLEKSTSNLSTVTCTPVDRIAPHRALGGFAGGFGGVSGLKCRVPPPSSSLFSSSDSLSEKDKMSDSISDDDIIDSKNIPKTRLWHKHDKVERWVLEPTANSACSQIEGTGTSIQKQQPGGPNCFS